MGKSTQTKQGVKLSSQSNKTCYSIPTKTSKKIEIFREHMIEQLYFDLTEETNDTIIYGKSFSGLQVSSGRAFPSGQG